MDSSMYEESKLMVDIFFSTGIDGRLTEREKMILQYRFILKPFGNERTSNYGNYTLSSIGKIIGVTPERVRQIADRALRKIRWRFSDVRIENGVVTYFDRLENNANPK